MNDVFKWPPFSDAPGLGTGGIMYENPVVMVDGNSYAWELSLPVLPWFVAFWSAVVVVAFVVKSVRMVVDA